MQTKSQSKGHPAVREAFGRRAGATGQDGLHREFLPRGVGLEVL